MTGISRARTRQGLSFLSIAATLTAAAVSLVATPAAASTTCGGKLQFGQTVSCASISGAEEHVYRVTTKVDSDRLFVDLTRGSGDTPSASLTTLDGELLCVITNYATTCDVGAAGTYKIKVIEYFQGTGDYTLGVESMKTPSSCTALPAGFFSFASPGVSGTLPAGTAARCFRFDQPVGSVLHLADPSSSGDVQGTIVDATYQPQCGVRDETTCTLSQAGPYRLFLFELYGAEAAYTLRMPRISHPVGAGCPVLRLAAFGDPGDTTAAGTLPEPADIACHRLRVANAGPVSVRLNMNQWIEWALYSPDGQPLCPNYADPRTCSLPAAGDYTLLVENRHDFGGEINYQVAVTGLYRNAGCTAATGTSWDLPALLVHQTSAVQTNCQLFKGKAGDRIVTFASPTAYNSVNAWLVDSAGNSLCTEWSENDGCVLPATGTYKYISRLWTWDAGSTDLTYKAQIRRLSDPVGCPTVAPGSWGSAPAGALGGIRCRILDVPAAGSYIVRAVDAQNYDKFGRIYDSAGLTVCGTPGCDFPAAGKYTMVLGGGNTDAAVIDNDVQYSTVLLPATPTGCATASDSADPIAAHRGSLVAGQYDCLQLASPTDAKIFEVVPGAASPQPAVTIIDATGTQVCDSSYTLRDYACTLTGTAPFYARISQRSGATPGAYTLAFPRVDGPPACPTLAAGDPGATVTTGADSFAACFSVPADGHAAREVVTFRQTAGSGTAELAVLDATGLRRCGTLQATATQRTYTCTLPDGPATILFEATATDATYQLTHTAAAS